MTHYDRPWPAGTPCWADLMAVDLDRTQEFYRTVLGWEYTASQPEYGGYCNALVDGGPVAGLSPTMEGMESAPHLWQVYLAADDIAGTGEQAAAYGATALVEPMHVEPFGWMGVWQDPTGAAFGLWQSEQHTGFTRTDEPGAVAWCDLMTPDPDTARDFYAQVFGYSYQDAGMDTMPYVLFTVPGGERPAGGIGGTDPSASSIPPAWSVCFQVPDVDAALRTARGAGGAVVEEPFDFEYGRLGVLSGPDGEVFAVMAPNEAM